MSEDDLKRGLKGDQFSRESVFKYGIEELSGALHGAILSILESGEPIAAAMAQEVIERWKRLVKEDHS